MAMREYKSLTNRILYMLARDDLTLTGAGGAKNANPCGL